MPEHKLQMDQGKAGPTLSYWRRFLVHLENA
jgi:hypothetical protein